LLDDARQKELAALEALRASRRARAAGPSASTSSSSAATATAVQPSVVVTIPAKFDPSSASTTVGPQVTGYSVTISSNAPTGGGVGTSAQTAPSSSSLSYNTDPAAAMAAVLARHAEAAAEMDRLHASFGDDHQGSQPVLGPGAGHAAAAGTLHRGLSSAPRAMSPTYSAFSASYAAPV